MRLFPGESGLLLFGLFAARLSHQIKMIFVGLRIGLKHAPDFLTLRQALSHLCCGCSSSEKINFRVHAGNRTNGRTIGPDCAPGLTGRPGLRDSRLSSRMSGSMRYPCGRSAQITICRLSTGVCGHSLRAPVAETLVELLGDAEGVPTEPLSGET